MNFGAKVRVRGEYSKVKIAYVNKLIGWYVELIC